MNYEVHSRFARSLRVSLLFALHFRTLNFREVLARLFREILQAVFATELNLLSLVNENVGLAVVEAFTGDQAGVERIRLRRGRSVVVMFVPVA